MSDVYHLGLTRADLEGARVALLPGDPGRVERIAAKLENPRFVVSNREFTTHIGDVEGRGVVVCSTGIGGPSTSIALEELAQLGVDTFIRVGTTGAIQPDLTVGSMIITQGSVRLDGASGHFAPPEYPAVSTFECTRALVDAAEAAGVPYRVGITASADTFYPGQERYDTVSGHVIERFRGSLAEWQALGVLNYEMESSTLFTFCTTNGFRGGCIAGAIVNRTEQETPDDSVIEATEGAAIGIAVDAVRRL